MQDRYLPARGFMLTLFRKILVREIAAFAALALFGMAAAQAQDAAMLKARHEALRGALNQNQFQRPLVLDSSETSSQLKGDIYARIAQPYAVVSRALQDIGHWCDLLIVHLNVKGCRSSVQGPIKTLRLNVGRKSDQALEDTYPFAFLYRVASSTPDYLQVVLSAADGPLGTSNYRMVLEVVQLDAKSSFLHLSYAYDFGLSARVAMRSYLATKGRDKRGFSIVGTDAGGKPILIGGTRGVIERNTMRYYLAIEAYLGALAVPAALRLEKRLNDWHAGIERYPVQLHELERDEYLAMKRREVQRLETQTQTAAPQ